MLRRGSRISDYMFITKCSTSATVTVATAGRTPAWLLIQAYYLFGYFSNSYRPMDAREVDRVSGAQIVISDVYMSITILG